MTTYVTEILESVHCLKLVSPQGFRRWTCLRLLRRTRKRANHPWCVPWNDTVIEVMDNVQDTSRLLQNTRVTILYSGSRHVYFPKTSKDTHCIYYFNPSNVYKIRGSTERNIMVMLLSLSEESMAA